MLNRQNILLVAVCLCTLLSGCAAVVVGTAATSAVVAQDRRTTGTFVEDKSIQLKAFHAIQQVSRDNPNIHASAITFNNRVLLVGQVPSQRVKNDIDAQVRGIEKAKQVHNEIVVAEPTTLKTRSVDTWLTTRIKSELALTKDMNPTRVKVITEDGIVYLMGIIKPFEEDIAVDIARNVKGVKKVVKIFEYETA